MTMMKTFKIHQVFFITLIIFVNSSHGRIPSVRLCGDSRCETIISMAKTTFNYNAGDKDMVSFRGNTQCRVLAKSVGENSDLWEIEVQGRRGWAPKKMLMEQKILIKASELIQIISETTLEENKTTEEKTLFENNQISAAGEKGVDSSRQDDADLEPVDEPLLIKQYQYKTGENEKERSNEDDVRLEIVGIENESDGINENTVIENQNSSSTDRSVLEIDDMSKSSDEILHSNQSIEMDIESDNTDTKPKENDLLDPVGSDTFTSNNTSLNSTEDNNLITKDPEQVHSSTFSNTSIEMNIMENQDDGKPSDDLFAPHITQPDDDQMESVVFQHKSHDDQDTESDQIDESNLLPPSDNESTSKAATENTSEESVYLSNKQRDERSDQQQEQLPEQQASPSNKQRDEKSDQQQEQLPEQQAEQETIEEKTNDNMSASHSEVDFSESSTNKLEQRHEQPLEQKTEQETKKQTASESIFINYSDVDFSEPSTKQSEEIIWYEKIVSGLQDLPSSMRDIYEFYIAGKNDEDSDSSGNSREMIDNGYCDISVRNSCPNRFVSHSPDLEVPKDSSFMDKFAAQLIAMTDLVVLFLTVSSTILIFIFGHYCIVNHRREGALISKLNIIERKLFLSEKECSVAKTELMETCKKLSSIANKSFGTDDMIKECEREKNELREQIVSLEKELETAAEAGLELNKMVSELLNNQSGSDSIINSVEELQQQLNEQEATTVYINNLLAEKSRENSELKVLLKETSNKYVAEIDEMQILIDKNKTEKGVIETDMKKGFQALETEYNQRLQEKLNDITKCKEENVALRSEFNELLSKWQASEAQVEALNETLNRIKNSNPGEIDPILEITDANAKYLAAKKESESIRERMNMEIECKNRLQEQLKDINNDLIRLRSEAHQNEKEKLEAQTRLDVLSNYFKEKESQLQKELSIKEGLFMKQKGESTSTVERVRLLQEEIQQLRSQNDQLRAEIEAQSAAQKAQINAAEIRAHDSWLAAKQGERRLEEARSEASMLRKKLTNLTLNKTSAENNFSRNNPSDGQITDMNAPSPIHMDSPSSPLMNLPPPPLIPTLFNAGMSSIPFMPPPPLPLPKEIRPAPLGRLMSPPPPDHRFSEEFVEQNRYRSHHYSPERHGYPTDLYETETDFSPPRSPRSPELYDQDRSYRYFSPTLPMKNKSTKESKDSSSEKSNIHSSDEWDRQTF